MKKIFNFLKILLCGILPAIFGSLITFDIMYIINNIKLIYTASGWDVVGYFITATIEVILAVCLLYQLGVVELNSNKWIMHKREEAANNIDSSPSDCETANETADRSSDKKSNNKCKKS